jgi:hypothetical protein
MSIETPVAIERTAEVRLGRTLNGPWVLPFSPEREQRAAFYCQPLKTA